MQTVARLGAQDLDRAVSTLVKSIACVAVIQAGPDVVYFARSVVQQVA